jgi:hypothetical protein
MLFGPQPVRFIVLDTPIGMKQITDRLPTGRADGHTSRARGSEGQAPMLNLLPDGAIEFMKI